MLVPTRCCGTLAPWVRAAAMSDAGHASRKDGDTNHHVSNFFLPGGIADELEATRPSPRYVPSPPPLSKGVLWVHVR